LISTGSVSSVVWYYNRWWTRRQWYVCMYISSFIGKTWHVKAHPFTKRVRE